MNDLIVTLESVLDSLVLLISQLLRAGLLLFAIVLLVMLLIAPFIALWWLMSDWYSNKRQPVSTSSPLSGPITVAEMPRNSSSATDGDSEKE